MRDTAGKVVLTQTIPFCPDTYDPEKVAPAARDQPVPVAVRHRPVRAEHGVGGAAGWATDPAASNFFGRDVKLALGKYQVTGTIAPAYTKLFHIPARDATATVKVTVVKGPKCCPVPGCCLPGPAPRAGTGHGHRASRSDR